MDALFSLSRIWLSGNSVFIQARSADKVLVEGIVDGLIRRSRIQDPCEQTFVRVLGSLNLVGG